MPRLRTREERLMGAAVLQASAEHRVGDEAEAFCIIYRDVLADLEVTDEEVSAFRAAHRYEVEARVRRGGPP
ncbi:MAG: hypothetical protein HY904_23910 [Deltaproteobacteria bacterium]|nr:hypothetical protein [Deltaproteobacteria bacterium]